MYLKNAWYVACLPHEISDKPLGRTICGERIVFYRGEGGRVVALEDFCPHRGAPLSLGQVLGDRLSCPYHGVEVRCDGVTTRVPGSPGCKLEGTRATAHFHVKEAAGAVFLYNSSGPVDEPPPLVLPEELTNDAEYGHFLCYTEWKGDYRYVLDNVMDPMHGAYLHAKSHSMAEGDKKAEMRLRKTDLGLMFEKVGQRDVNFDWTEWGETGAYWMRLAIPYQKKFGPGGQFFIAGFCTPVDADNCQVYFWRCRKVEGWARDTWKFMYRNRLEGLHWDVLEQDRIVLENMAPDARNQEFLYQHDVGLARIRRVIETKAKENLEALAKVKPADKQAQPA